MFNMRRREFITLLGGAAATWPLAARAQQAERMRRIGFLMNTAADVRTADLHCAFRAALQQLGWTEGRNLQVDTRWAAGSTSVSPIRAGIGRACAGPDPRRGGGSLFAVQAASRGVIPIVFVQSVDPIGGGVVASLARPGGNVDRLYQFEYTLSGKWLELLKEIEPRVTRVAILRNSTISRRRSGNGRLSRQWHRRSESR